MIIKREISETPLDGLEVAEGAGPFVPCAKGESFAVYRRGNLSCGVHLITRDISRSLMFHPSWRPPHGAHGRDAWNRFIFEAEDERMVEMRMDPDDGEIYYVYSDTPLEDLDDIERSIERGLDFVFSTYLEILAYVRWQLGLREGGQ